MKVDRIVLNNYRNYANLAIDFDGGLNVFIGRNAQGKTNILEAVYLGAMGKSHRTSQDDELVNWDQDASSVEIFFNRQGVGNRIKLKFARDQRKEILLNDFPIKPRDLIGSLNAVLFSPEDLWLVKGAPVQRRHFLDIEISQASPLYYRQLLQYNRIIAQRNNLLKKIKEKTASVSLLASWDDQLADSAAVIVSKRLEALKKLSMLANLMHRRLTASKENFSIAYRQASEEQADLGDLAGWFRKKLTQTRNIDILRGSTSIGPHRDDLILTVNNRDLRSFGSQGQQRTGILALKLSELEFLKSETGEYPVLLLDDVMSELDGQRREQLLNFIRDRIQTFITATDAALFPAIKAGRHYKVSNGNIVE